MVSRQRPERQHARALMLSAVTGGLLLQSLGCAAHFRPTVPMRARTGDIEVELDTIRVAPAREFTFLTRSTAPHTLGSGWLTVASRPPCSGGANLDRVLVDGVATSGDSTLTPGAHQLKARLNRAGGDLSLDLVVDVRMDEHGCLRAPALSQLLPVEAPKRPMLIASMMLDLTNDLSGLRGVTAFQVGAGLWVGSVLVAAHGGIGLSLCQADVCGKDSEGQLRNGLALPLAVDARLTLGSATVGLLENFIALGMRYSFVPARLPTLTGDRTMSLHGIQGILSWSFSDGLGGPFLHRERASMYEFIVPLGIFVDPDAPARQVAFAGGFGLRMLFAL